MNANEMRELDAWIAAHVMGWQAPPGYRDLRADVFQPTQSSSDAMEVLKKCAEKCMRPMDGGGSVSSIIGIAYGGSNPRWTVGFHPPKISSADTLELAICLFAKKLFGQQIPHNESPTSDRDAIPRTSHT